MHMHTKFDKLYHVVLTDGLMDRRTDSDSATGRAIIIKLNVHCFSIIPCLAWADPEGETRDPNRSHIGPLAKRHNY